jgi:hypothetical protein
LLPILPSGEIIPDNLINATTGVLEKNNILPLILIFNLNQIYKIVTKIIIIFNIIVTFKNKVISYKCLFFNFIITK